MIPLSSLSAFFIQQLNRLLTTLAPLYFAPLEKHYHKILCLQITHCSPVYFQVNKTGFLTIVNPTHIDATFSGTLSAFITSLFTKKRTHTGLHVKGDMEFAKAIDECWQHFNIDWEDCLANAFGDNIAHFISQGMQISKQFVSDNFQNRTEDLTIYLQDETNLLPNPQEVAAFYKEVDVLRHDVDRFEAKVNLLLQRHSTK
ncbi:MAG: hypothetical protein JSS07_02695 [Proteobacteria bacterium]|nr:hypothetical protein [Pseudomonadota bacterium]